MPLCEACGEEARAVDLKSVGGLLRCPQCQEVDRQYAAAIHSDIERDYEDAEPEEEE